MGLRGDTCLAVVMEIRDIELSWKGRKDFIFDVKIFMTMFFLIKLY